MSDNENGPLAGTLVLDLSRALAGPHAAMMMGDQGARVIKVEPPVGDDSRGWGPPFVGDPERPESTYFFAANRNKESIALDLKTVEGRELLESMVRRADVLVENFRAGTLDRLGLGVEHLHRLNPQLVILSISGFGHDGPEGGRPGYDQIAQGEAGLMSLTGSGPDDPQRVGVPIADLLAGIYGAYGVLSALHERTRTGVGRVVRTSLLAAVIGAHANQGTAQTVGHQTGHARGNHHPSIAPYGLFRCKGGAIQISCGSEKLWHRLCAEFGLDSEAEGLATNRDRVENFDLVRRTVEDAFATDDADSLLARLDKAGIPAGRVRELDEVYAWDQTASQRLLVDVEHSSVGRITLPGPPLRFFAGDSDQELPGRTHAAPPTFDQHGAALRAEFAPVPAGTAQR